MIDILGQGLKTQQIRVERSIPLSALVRWWNICESLEELHMLKLLVAKRRAAER
jgi:hypothetical protein